MHDLAAFLGALVGGTISAALLLRSFARERQEWKAERAALLSRLIPGLELPTETPRVIEKPAEYTGLGWDYEGKVEA